MKANWRMLGFLVGLMFCLHCANAAKTSTNQTGFRLTIELQDGSKIIGKNGDETFLFRSDVLGEMKLPLEKIRSIECQPKTNSAKLSTVNGDTLAVWFTMKEVRVETAFGNFKLPANQIRRVLVSAIGKGHLGRSGLVALWSGENNGDDAVGDNPAMPIGDVSFAEGKIGRAFSLNGFDSYLKISPSQSLNVGDGDGLTITAWVKPASVNTEGPIVEWSSENNDGLQLWVVPGLQLFTNLKDTSDIGHTLKSFNNSFSPNSFQHVAVTYDKNSGMAVLYINGNVVASQTVGNFTPQTAYPLFIGRRVGQPIGLNQTYNGSLDEIAIYNRALSAAEIQEICTEDNNGEPLPAPPQAAPRIPSPRTRFPVF